MIKIEQRIWSADKKKWEKKVGAGLKGNAQLVWVFGKRELLAETERFTELRKEYPSAHIILGSSAGEIWNNQVLDNTIVATAATFEKTQIKTASQDIKECANSYEVGQKLGEKLEKNGLKHVFVLSDGLGVNGSELIAGLTHALPEGVIITGGLSGDGAAFQCTLVGLDAPPQEHLVIAVGFYGEALKVGFGSVGGWDPFGPERIITKSEGNILYELDNQPALQLYKAYLGEEAAKLPASGLKFPLSIRKDKNSEEAVVRTILAIDEEKQSLTFAGDIPQGALARLMKANFDRLIEGASEAATRSTLEDNDLAILISCVGRKLILGQRIDEEVESVKEKLGGNTFIAGFYSYGELAPGKALNCLLHNQTMTITTYKEI
ncbi:MAG: FIST C-terminal domain-containing protein [Bacteroidia bacterium]|nr:FIST C-terminal domain-containing protein [Bacteroidia bacterium]